MGGGGGNTKVKEKKKRRRGGVYSGPLGGRSPKAARDLGKGKKDTSRKREKGGRGHYYEKPDVVMGHIRHAKKDQKPGRGGVKS